jgi:PTH1 family peptidyl-tRNA hydrolase
MSPADTFDGWLLAGLGNPDEEYAGTRHNAGFEVLERLAQRWRSSGWTSRFHGRFASVQPAGLGCTVLLLKPMTYMNLSGRSVQGAMAFYRVPPARVLVIHDDMDLEFGTLRLKDGGGTAGHRGLESLAGAVGAGFLRLRVGIGRPEHRDAADFVLSRFNATEAAALPPLLDQAAEMVERCLREGPQKVMNAFHRRRRPAPADESGD